MPIPVVRVTSQSSDISGPIGATRLISVTVTIENLEATDVPPTLGFQWQKKAKDASSFTQVSGTSGPYSSYYTITNLQQGISQTAATIGNLGTYTDLETAANVMTGTNDPVLTTPYVRQALSAATTEYLVAVDTFTVAALTATGHVHCRKNPLQG